MLSRHWHFLSWYSLIQPYQTCLLIFLKEIQNTFYQFLWDGKPDNVRRKVIRNEYKEGGLKFIHIESFCKALKMSWLHKLLGPLNVSPWKAHYPNMVEIRYSTWIKRVWNIVVEQWICFGRTFYLICWILSNQVLPWMIIA